MKHTIVVVLVLMSVAMILPFAAQADDPNICIRLTPEASTVGAPVVILDVFASNKAGSRATVYGLNGTASSTIQSSNPPTELFYLLSGTAYVTTKTAIELSLTGTAEDAECDCIRESVFHVIFDGKNDRYFQTIKGTLNVVVTGTAEVSRDCGKKK